jgi:Protein of unknown function (DUF1275)
MLSSRRNLALACTLSALAGYVDAIGFLHLGGMFVSFMSGNSTRLGVSLAQGNWSNAAEAIGVIALFVTGAAAGSLIVFNRSFHGQGWVLLVEASLLAAAALSHALGAPRLAIAAMVLAMGLENAVFQAKGGAGLAHLCHRRAGEGRPARRGRPDRRPALGVAAELAALGGPGRRRGGRRLCLSLDQSVRDLVCRRRGAVARHPCFRNGAAAGLTATAAWPN